MKSKFILLHPQDNVLVCCQPADAGDTVAVGTENITLTQALELGHKVAARALAGGDKIVKYGVSIGSAVQNIRPGEHVHLHNMKSDYIPAHTRSQPQEISAYK
ncbi:MAG: UxaA family hydrolase [Gammaproteobacteria bacterium]|nr:UxaA family hydrolase [Gammaproteobacteria bacterium]MCY4210534.1 UxaA family hydrolase [Gammaproteobacteria bacterium]MCY4282264.1 UxaA family hydrolase [Gammaproteobacteria bacterium]MCY4337502.1 UxaA family hydrolase [Gammaproteobacteria bacterium]